MVLANLSIAFNRLKHDLLIAKLRASGFNYEYLNRFGNTLTFITLAYLKGKKKMFFSGSCCIIANITSCNSRANFDNNACVRKKRLTPTVTDVYY